MARILGVDPGTHITGYGVVDAGQGTLRHVSHGLIRTRSKDPLWVRLKVIHDRLCEVVASERPDVLSLERCFVGKNIQSALKLGHTRGAIMMACMTASLDVVEYAPGEIKRAVAGSGRAEKSQVAQMVRVLLRLDEAPQVDAADALAAAICHAHAPSPALFEARP